MMLMDTMAITKIVTLTKVARGQRLHARHAGSASENAMGIFPAIPV